MSHKSDYFIGTRDIPRKPTQGNICLLQEIIYFYEYETFNTNVLILLQNPLKFTMETHENDTMQSFLPGNHYKHSC